MVPKEQADSIRSMVSEIIAECPDLDIRMNMHGVAKYDVDAWLREKHMADDCIAIRLNDIEDKDGVKEGFINCAILQGKEVISGVFDIDFFVKPEQAKYIYQRA